MPRRSPLALALVLASSVALGEAVARADDPLPSYQRSRSVLAKESSVLEVFGYFNGGDAPAYCTFELSERKGLKVVSGSLKELSVSDCDRLVTTLQNNRWVDVPAPAPEYDKFKMQRLSYAKAFKYVTATFKARAPLAKTPREVPFEASAEVDGMTVKEVFTVQLPEETRVEESARRSSFDGEAAVHYLLDTPTAIDFYFRELGVMKNVRVSLKGRTKQAVSEVDGAGFRELLALVSDADRKALASLPTKPTSK